MHHPINFAHYLETPATIAGILNVYLAARTNIWNYLFGIITVTLFGIIFFQTKLYADMSLQMVYFALQFYGWYQWTAGGEKHTALQVHPTPKKMYGVIAGIILILFFGYRFILHHYTDSTTVVIDALTTAMSLAAQWMMSKKWLENWVLWMLINIISIKMYLIKHLYLTSGLYGVFFIICVMGFITWKKQMSSNATDSLINHRY